MVAGRMGPVSCAAVALLAGPLRAHGQPIPESAPGDQPRTEAATGDAGQAGDAEASADYGGDLADRGFLSGDWDGRRTKLDDAGLTLDIHWTQVGQGVVSGGRRRDWDYGGNLDVLVTADLERMRLGPAGTLSLRGESRYGETVNDDSGAFTPVNTRGYFPLASGINEGIPFTITELNYSLSLSGTLDLTLGKMITLDGDPTEFAGGRGRTQFLNSNFIYNAVTSQTSPYSTLGAALDWSPAPWLTLSSAVFSTTDSSTTSGFEHLDDGWTLWAQASAQYTLGTLPGGANIGFQQAFDNDFVNLGGKLTLTPGGVGVETVNDSWAVFCGAWQYLYSPDPPPDELDAFDDRADLRGVGLFARAGLADPDANPVHWSASIGVGGRGLFPGREDDTFGAGYYYTELQDVRAFSLIGLPSSAQGLEAYYNIAITPAVGLTLDVQRVDEGFVGFDPATILGVRLEVTF
ncbi:MAG: carbohydrate porin [Phycisphaerales bacterium]|nr:carbohydrate porin [Phycisphaerales bacterium]